MMNSFTFTQDLWTIILARLPLKSVITFKLVCKQWKSLFESAFFRNLYMSLHQNSYPSSWSLLCRGCETEIVAHYGSDNWFLTRSLGSYISAFLSDKFQNGQGRVVAYTDVGLILIHAVTDQSFYLANPVSRQCVEILPRVPLEERFWILGIAARTDHGGLVLGYKVVFLKTNFSFLIFSSETGSWSLENVSFPFSYISQEFNNPISLNGSLHWLAHNLEFQDFVVSIDLYASGSTGFNQCRATPFPDLDKVPRFKRACTTAQGFLMYMNIVPLTKFDGSIQDKLCVWRLEGGEWKLVSEISTNFIEIGFNYVPLGINPFDATIVYFWRWNRKRQCLLSINLCTGEFVLHIELERNSDGRIQSSVECLKDMEYILESHFSSFILPLWLHPFPNMVRRV